LSTQPFWEQQFEKVSICVKWNLLVLFFFFEMQQHILMTVDEIDKDTECSIVLVIQPITFEEYFKITFYTTQTSYSPTVFNDTMCT
jgi:hypothetical protein